MLTKEMLDMSNILPFELDVYCLKGVMVSGYQNAYIFSDSNDPDLYYSDFLFIDTKRIIQSGGLKKGEKIVVRQINASSNADLRFSIGNSYGFLKSPYIYEIVDIDSITIPRQIDFDSTAERTKVYVDNAYMGETPVSVTVKGIRNISIRAEKEGYVTQKLTYATEKNNAIKINMGLYDMDPRVLTVNTTPTQNSALYLNGRYVGTSGKPFTYYGRIFSGDTIRADANGLSSTMTIGALGKGEYAYNLAFDAEPRNVTITSSPTSASYTLNGKNIGEQTGRATVYGKGSFKVEASENGIRQSYTISTPEMKAYSFNLDFNAEPRTIKLSIHPSDAIATLNGKTVQSGTYTVYQENNEITVKKTGYLSESKSVTVKNTDKISVSVSLEYNWTAARENKETSGLYVGGNYLMSPKTTGLGFTHPGIFGGRVSWFKSDAENLFLLETGIDAGYDQKQITGVGQDTIFYCDCFFGVGMKFWLGSVGFIYPKITGYGGFLSKSLEYSKDSTYKTTKEIRNASSSDNALYGELEASLGFRMMLGNKFGLSCEYGLRPQMQNKPSQPDDLKVIQVFQAGMFF